MKRTLPYIAIVLAAWTVPGCADVLLNTDAHAGFDPLPFGNTQLCMKDVFGLGSLTTATCSPAHDSGTEPGNIPYVATLSANASAQSAFGGKLGVHDFAAVSANPGNAFLGVGAKADALVEDNVHPHSLLVPLGALMDIEVNVRVDGALSTAITGAVNTYINSLLGFALNTGTLSVPNFANTPGVTHYSFDAGLVANGGTADFIALMDSQVAFSPVPTFSSLDASISLDYLDTAQITSITATYNGQPVTDLTVTGDSGASYPTTPVPEPGMFAPLAIGLGGLLWRRLGQRAANSRRSHASA